MINFVSYESIRHTHTQVMHKLSKSRRRNKRNKHKHHTHRSNNKHTSRAPHTPRTPHLPNHIYIYFVHVPKTAGSAIKHTLLSNDTRRSKSNRPREGWLLHTRKGVPVHIIARGHSTASSFPPRGRNVFKMATIREPIERFISAYNFVREGGKNHPNQGAVQQARNWAPFLQKYDTIDAFLDDKKAVQTIMHPKTGHTHFDHLSRWVSKSKSKNEPDIDFYIRQTHVDQDFRAFCDTFDLQIADGTVQPFNVTGTKSRRTPHTVREIKRILHEDIRLYDSILRSLDNTRRRVKRE